MNDGTDSLGYIYNQFNQLQEVSKNNETQTTYEYDLRGNQIQESSKYFDLTIGGVTTTYYNTTDYFYNLRNQMTGTQISTPGADTQTGEVTYETLTASNVYNAQGQRVQKTEGTDTTKYFYSGTALFYTTNGWGTLITENILDLGGQIAASKRFQDPNEPEANPFANKYYFYNYDIRGSVTNIVGPDGNLVTGYGYDEFGNQSRSGDGSFLNEVTFTGSVSDASTGLQYMNARFYQPTTGRFISQDSYSGNAYDPWTQHLYSYCMNNPTNFIDPTGHTAHIAYEYMMRAAKQIIISGGNADHLTPLINYAKKEKDKTRTIIAAKLNVPKEELDAIDSLVSDLTDNEGKEIVTVALTRLGTKYGRDIDNYYTFYCSSFVFWTYRKAGIDYMPDAEWNKPPDASRQAKRSKKYNKELVDNPLPGDIIYWSMPNCKCNNDNTACSKYDNIHHMGIYLGKYKGEDYVIDASESNGRVIVRPMSNIPADRYEVAYYAHPW